MIGYIYKTCNTVNGKVYIGKRYGPYDPSYLGSGLALKSAVKKYGRDMFTNVIIKECSTEQELNESEIDCIKKMRPEYNIAEGGTGGFTLMHSPDRHEEAIEKRRNSLVEHYSTRSDEQAARHNQSISEGKKGKVVKRSNYTHSSDVKKRISESNKKAAKNRPDSWHESRKTIAENMKGKPNKSCYKPVTINGIQYPSIKHAMEELGKSRPTIMKMVTK